MRRTHDGILDCTYSGFLLVFRKEYWILHTVYCLRALGTASYSRIPTIIDDSIFWQRAKTTVRFKSKRCFNQGWISKKQQYRANIFRRMQFTTTVNRLKQD